MRTSKTTLDWTLICLVGALLSVGLLVVYSSSYALSLRLTGIGTTFFERQLVVVVAGIFGMAVLYWLPLSWIVNRHFLWIGLGVLLLLGVFVPGLSREVAGAKRWIDVGFVRLQPSELVKLALVMFMSKMLAVKQDKINLFFYGSFPVMVVGGLVILLVALEPDISTAFLLGLVTLSLVRAAGVSWTHIAFLVCAGIPFLLAFFESKKYWVSRFLFLNTNLDPFGKGYHVRQSLLGFREGGLFGKGPGHFIESAKKLPDAHTDFAFSVVGLEFGFVGCAITLALFVAVVWRCFNIAFSQNILEYQLLALGIGFTIAWEVAMHVFVTLGLAPTTGLPLPFVSYGRTALLVHLLMVGFLLNLSRQARSRQNKDSKNYGTSPNNQS